MKTPFMFGTIRKKHATQQQSMHNKSLAHLGLANEEQIPNTESLMVLTRAPFTSSAYEYSAQSLVLISVSSKSNLKVGGKAFCFFSRCSVLGASNCIRFGSAIRVYRIWKNNMGCYFPNSPGKFFYLTHNDLPRPSFTVFSPLDTG